MNVKDRWGGTPLSDAVRHKHHDVARILYKSGGVLGYDEETTSSTLCELAKSGRLESIGVVLECGGDISAADCAPQLA